MYSKEKLLEMITSKKSSDRFDACEWIRISQESSPEFIYALKKGTQDEDVEIALRAQLALQADIHHQMMIQMGLIEPDVIEGAGDELQDSGSKELDASNQALDDHTRMLKAIRNWGFWSIGWGVLSLVLSGFFSAPWGVILIAIGLSSFIFQASSMFIIYGLTLAWAAIWNILSFNISWIIPAIFQIYFAVRVFMDYQRYRKIEEAYLGTISDPDKIAPLTNRSARAFPWIGSCLGCSSIFGYMFFFLLIILISIGSNGTARFPNYFSIIEGLLLNMGVLGFGFGLASILSTYRPKALGIIGMIAGALTLFVFITLYFLGKFV